MSDWYVMINDQEMGPYADEVLIELADTKQLTKDTLVWKEGMSDWSYASDIGILKGHGEIPKLKVNRASPPEAPPPSPIGQMQTQQPIYADPQAYSQAPAGQAYNPLVEGAVARAQTQSITIETGTVSLGDWMLTLLLISIPLINLIVMLIYIFDSNTNESKRNFFKAIAIYMLIYFVILLIAILIPPIAEGFMEADNNW